MVSSAPQDKSNLILPLAVIGALIPLAGFGWWYLNRQSAGNQPAPLTAEAKTYVRNLKLSGVEMKAAKSYTGSMLVEITGSITNTGDRTLARVELNCVFYDPNGMVVLRERVPIVRTALKPGETRSFRLPFEGLAESWNQAMPQLVIANIHFAG